jgi:hypothetical protein
LASSFNEIIAISEAAKNAFIATRTNINNNSPHKSDYIK